MTYYAGTYI